MPSAAEKVHLDIKTVIGTDDPMDGIMLIPLIVDWHVPRECIWNITGENCDTRLRRLYVLNEPLHGFGGGPEGFAVVGVCEEHHRAFMK